MISDENAYIAWNPINPAEGFKVVSNYGASKENAAPSHWRRVYKGDTVHTKDGLQYVIKGLNESNNRIETMRYMCAVTGLKSSKNEGRQDFSLTPSKRTGSMSLWDITEIITDPFDGDPHHG